ncbi:MAG: hypothetical protein M3N53_14135 [Actinomycetota bacterium]|nr:hypothetical protein [Actinomycetota bacterium]
MAGNDVLAGGEADDCLVGDPVKQFEGCFYLTPTGEAGNDTLVGDRGDDSLWGLGGDDHYVGGPGEDTAGFFHSPSGVTVDLGSGQASGEGSDSLRWIEIVRGSQFDDVLTGDEGDNVLDGGRGADTLRGAGGNDALVVGGPEADAVEGGAGSDTAQYQCSGSGIALQVDLQAGTDSIGNTLIEVENVSVGGCLAAVAGDDGPNRIVAAGELAGRGGDDVLLGGYSDDVLNGGDGNDVLDGRGGTDACTEGETVVRCE